MAGPFVVIVMMAVLVCTAMSYQYNSEKENFLTDRFLREMAHHMSRDLAVAAAADGYSLDLPESSEGFMNGRAMKAIQDDTDDGRLPLDMELEGLSPPSLRDREFLQHSSLWGSQMLGSNPAEPHGVKPDANMLAQAQMKQTDPALPAYCNPPNPCPVGYSAEDGCLEEFENTAAFSRKYQAMQECMCDSEHMFDCPIREEQSDYDSELDDTFLNELAIQDQHKNLVAKKFHVKKSSNPYLQGEKLPIAAKKGNQLG